MDSIAISRFRNNLPSLIDDVNKYMKRLIISVSGKPKAVVLSLEDLEALEETAEILSTPNAYKNIVVGLKQAKQKRGILLRDLKI